MSECDACLLLTPENKILRLQRGSNLTLVVLSSCDGAAFGTVNNPWAKEVLGDGPPHGNSTAVRRKRKSGLLLPPFLEPTAFAAGCLSFMHIARYLALLGTDRKKIEKSAVSHDSRSRRALYFRYVDLAGLARLTRLSRQELGPFRLAARRLYGYNPLITLVMS